MHDRNYICQYECSNAKARKKKSALFFVRLCIRSVSNAIHYVLHTGVFSAMLHILRVPITYLVYLRKQAGAIAVCGVFTQLRRACVAAACAETFMLYLLMQ